MEINRREFLRTLGLATAGGAGLGLSDEAALASSPPPTDGDWMGVLVDVTKCVGCRRCEFACQDAAGFKPPPIDTFENKSVFGEQRRPHPRSHTVINRYPNPADETRPLYNKFNCLHCLDPACKSACLVSAFSKRADGPVVYDAGRCMGCRYCMIACPFEIPTYEYDNALTPQVRKCNLCAQLVPEKQEVPACVKICPEEAMTYGRRSQLLDVAHEKILQHPGVYVDHVYGEHEAGGTSWLYLSSVPFEEVGFRAVGAAAPPRLTEKIQHAEFKHFVPPVMFYGLLGAIMWLTRQDQRSAAAGDE